MNVAPGSSSPSKPCPVPERAVYAFPFYLLITIAFAVYLFWLLAPEAYLPSVCPQQYWAVAIPIYVSVLFLLFVCVCYPSLGLCITPPSRHINWVADQHSVYVRPWSWQLEPLLCSTIPPMCDMHPAAVVHRQLLLRVRQLLQLDQVPDRLEFQQCFDAVTSSHDSALCREVLRLFRRVVTTQDGKQLFLAMDPDCLLKWCEKCIHLDAGDQQLTVLVLQFVSNLLVAAPGYEAYLWSGAVDFVAILCQNLDLMSGKQRNVIWAIIHVLSLRGQAEHLLLQVATEGQQLHLLQRLIADAGDDQLLSDFSTLCFGSLVKSLPDLLLGLYSGLQWEQRARLMDLFTEFAPDPRPQFWANVFKSKADSLLGGFGSGTQCAAAEDFCCETRKVLQMLCTMSCEERHTRTLLQEDRPLLISSISLLRMTHHAGKGQTDGPWAPARKLSDFGASEAAQHQASPVFGFKRDLIRLIGNLVFDHPDNQNLVNELEGLQLILDCSTNDAKNPFISQWVVLAVRNLCSASKPNQELLRSLEARGKVDATILSELGIQLNRD